MSRTSKARRDKRRKDEARVARQQRVIKQKKREEARKEADRRWKAEQAKTEEQKRQEREQQERERTRYEVIRLDWWINEGWDGVPPVWSTTKFVQIYRDTWAEDAPQIPDTIGWEGKTYISTRETGLFSERSRLQRAPGPPPAKAFVLDDEGLRTPAGTINRLADMVKMNGQGGRRPAIPPRAPTQKMRFA